MVEPSCWKVAVREKQIGRIGNYTVSVHGDRVWVKDLNHAMHAGYCFRRNPAKALAKAIKRATKLSERDARRQAQTDAIIEAGRMLLGGDAT